MNENGEEILKDDPLKKPKKLTIAFVVSVLAVLMVFMFASFHWICTDYFNFKANEGDARKQLEDIRAQCADEEAAAKKRLSEVEQKARVLEEETFQRAKASEADAQQRIQEAEQSAKSRIEALEQEYADKRAAKSAEYKKLVGELDESMASKKSDIAVLLRSYKDRYDAKTNDFELAIAAKETELLEIKRMISTLPDVKEQLLVASNALVTARAQRDAALKDERIAQEGYVEWNVRAESAKAAASELETRKDMLNQELARLSQATNTIHLTTVTLRGQVKTIQAQVVMAKAELQSIQEDIESAKLGLEDVQRQIRDAEKKRKDAELARTSAEDALSLALDKKRESETLRDKVRFEAAQAEAHWAKRKPEIEGLIKDMERILEMKSEAVKASAEKKEGGADK